MTSYNTVSEALKDLKGRGYVIDFNLQFHGIKPQPSLVTLSPDKNRLIWENDFTFLSSIKRSMKSEVFESFGEWSL